MLGLLPRLSQNEAPVHPVCDYGDFVLHGFGLLLSVLGIFRFYFSFQPLISLVLLLCNWGICILLEGAGAFVGIEILLQIPWRSLKLRNVTPLRYFVLYVMFTMGLINVHSMWQLCVEVHSCVLSHPEYGWMPTATLWSTISTAMFQAILLGELWFTYHYI